MLRDPFPVGTQIQRTGERKGYDTVILREGGGSVLSYHKIGSTDGPASGTMTEKHGCNQENNPAICRIIQSGNLPDSVRNGGTAGTYPFNKIPFNEILQVVTDSSFATIRQNLLNLL